jgi:hypothetical protein
MTPGTAVRSIAAEDYRLARDRGASFGRGKEEACAPECVLSTRRRTPDWGIWGCIAGRLANVAQGVKFLSANAKMRQRGSPPEFRISPTEPRMIRAKLRRLAHRST